MKLHCLCVVPRCSSSHSSGKKASHRVCLEDVGATSNSWYAFLAAFILYCSRDHDSSNKSWWRYCLQSFMDNWKLTLFPSGSCWCFRQGHLQSIRPVQCCHNDLIHWESTPQAVRMLWAYPLHMDYTYVHSIQLVAIASLCTFGEYSFNTWQIERLQSLVMNVMQVSLITMWGEVELCTSATRTFMAISHGQLNQSINPV